MRAVSIAPPLRGAMTSMTVIRLAIVGIAAPLRCAIVSIAIVSTAIVSGAAPLRRAVVAEGLAGERNGLALRAVEAQQRRARGHLVRVRGGAAARVRVVGRVRRGSGLG